MSAIQLTVNGRAVSESVEPRTHLADFLRERMNLTGTHLRCEQGVCGACTLLIDGEPARSCITYAALCDGAVITTIEGLENDPIAVALRQAFSQEHGLQCGFCTPGMLMTARDIITRLPEADDARIRIEISGNLCRCTGYSGIVRAISQVLRDRCAEGAVLTPRENRRRGPVGARPAIAEAREISPAPTNATPTGPTNVSSGETALGLGPRQPNIEIRQSFTVSRPPAEVWSFFQDIAQVASCLPGASVTQVAPDGRIDGKFSAKLGPITATFLGEARIARDDARQQGTVRGAGRDQLGGSRASGELDYSVAPTAEGTQINITLRALLAGPLAQFGRSGIVDDLVKRITRTFAANLEARLTGTSFNSDGQVGATLQAGALLRTIIFSRMKAAVSKVLAVLKS